MEDQMQGRPEAAAVIWSWRAHDGAESADPGDAASHLRKKGAIQALVGIGVGAGLFLLWSSVAGTIVMSIGGFILLAALFSPTGVFAVIERALTALGTQVARALTFVLMSAIFYTIFVPFGLLFRRGRRDPMKRSWQQDVASYWSMRDSRPPTTPSRTRQY